MKSAFDGNFPHLARAMDAAAKQLEALAKDTEWTTDSLATLDSVRKASQRLDDAAEAAIQKVQGK